LRKYLLAYDADCGPCTRFKQVVQFLDSYGKFDFESLIEADEEGFLDAISKSMRHSSFHIVSPNGIVLSGAQAIPTLIEQLPFGRPISRFVTSVPAGVKAIEFIYGVFSRLHDAGSCQYRPGQGPGHTNHMSESRVIPWGDSVFPIRS
jgi:predicted DCC family thiol-disulfide oxidoreductase YuxK